MGNQINANPIKCEAYYYPVVEINKECGTFTVDDEIINGYRIESSGESTVTLTWNLPESKQDVIHTLEKSSWTNSEILYDDFDCDCTRGYEIEEFDENGNQLENVDDFDGDCNLELESFSSDGGPESVKIFYNDGSEITFEKSNDGIMNLKLSGGALRPFPDYKEFVEEIKRIIIL